MGPLWGILRRRACQWVLVVYRYQLAQQLGEEPRLDRVLVVPVPVQVLL